jgi:hypothetical protein
MERVILDDQESEARKGYVFLTELINRTESINWVTIPLLTELIDNAGMTANKSINNFPYISLNYIEERFIKIPDINKAFILHHSPIFTVIKTNTKWVR